jgi:hypothetical protein
MLRGGGDEALRVAGGATGMRGGVAEVWVDVAAEACPCSARVSFSFMEDVAEEFVFTKRCSAGS